MRDSVSERVVPPVAGAAVGRAHVRRRLLHRLLPHRRQLLSAAGTPDAETKALHNKSPNFIFICESYRGGLKGGTVLLSNSQAEISRNLGSAF